MSSFNEPRLPWTNSSEILTQGTSLKFDRLEKNSTRESGNGVVSTDGQTENLIPIYPLFNFVEQGYNKAFREDNTPQPLDQWTNSPFIGQQVGNCKSFTLTQYLADLFAMHRGPRSISLCIQHHIQLTSLPFQVSQASHSWVTAISKFYLENPRSRSWVRSKFEVTMWV